MKAIYKYFLFHLKIITIRKIKIATFDPLTKYNELISQQQKIYDQVMREASTEQYPSLVSDTTGNFAPRKEPMQYTGERKLLGIAAMHKSNLVPVFEEDNGGRQYAEDLAHMRR